MKEPATTHTVHLDRLGYVDTVFRDTKKASLDERRYPGTLMEVTGEVCPGWLWDGHKFVLPPPRIHPDEVRAERDRRIEVFPTRFRAQVAAFGGGNAMAVSNYLAEVYRVADAMVDDAPRDYREDRHWPRIPELRDMPVPTKSQDGHSSSAPITISVAPVINATPGELKPVVIEQRAVSDSVRPVFDDYGLDRNDPLYERKQWLIEFIENEIEPKAPDDPAWKDALGRLAALHTASQSLEQIEEREAQVIRFIEGQAA